MLYLLFILLSTSYVIVSPFNQDICFHYPFDSYVTFDLIYSNPISINRIANLGYVAQCITPKQESQCKLIKEENSEDYSVAIYDCHNLDLEQELAILLDDENNYQTKIITAVVDDNIIGLSRQYYSSSIQSGEDSSEEDYY